MINCKLYRFPKNETDNWLLFQYKDEGKNRSIIALSTPEVLNVHHRISRGHIDGDTFVCKDKRGMIIRFEGIRRYEKKEYKKLIPRMVRIRLRNTIKILNKK